MKLVYHFYDYYIRISVNVYYNIEYNISVYN